jgi:hypothetical protein
MKAEKEIRASLINTIMTYARGTQQENAQIRAGLEAKNDSELQDILANAAIEQTLAQKDKLFQALAERDAAAFEYDQEHHQPKRDAEAKARLEQDQRTFQDAAKTLRSFGLTEANFNLIREVLGTGFSVHQIDQLIQANGIRLSPASTEEQNEWQKEAIEEYNKQLLKLADTDPLAFRKLVRLEGAQMAARAQGQQQEQQVRIRTEKDQAYGFEPLPEVDSYGRALDSLYFKKLSNTNYQAFKIAVRRFGAAQINERLRRGIK